MCDTLGNYIDKGNQSPKHTSGAFVKVFADQAWKKEIDWANHSTVGFFNVCIFNYRLTAYGDPFTEIGSFTKLSKKIGR